MMNKVYTFFLQKVPGFRIVLAVSILGLLVWSTAILRYNRQARLTEIQKYQDYLKSRSDEEIKAETAVETLDTVAFNRETHRQVADYYLERKQYKSAIPHLEMVVKSDNPAFVDENIGLCLKLADAYLKARLADRAVDYLRRIREFQNRNAAVVYRLGEAYYLQGQTDLAAECLREAIGMDPKQTEALTLLARLYSAQDHTRKDVEELHRKAVTETPKSVSALYGYGVWLADRGEYDRAEPLFRRALEAEPFHSPSLARLGTIYFYTGKKEKSREMYELALSINATDYNTHYNLGELLLTSFEDPLSAYPAFLAAIKIKPDHFGALKKLGIISLNNRNYKEAALWFERGEQVRIKMNRRSGEAITVDAELVSLYILHSTALEAIGRKYDAQILLKRALEEDPLNAIARHKLTLLQLNG